MFSRTTIASSIRMPMASDRPSSDIVFSVKPNASTATNEAMTETGSARPVMTVERQEFRNRNTISTVSSAPSTSAACDVGDRVRDARAGVADDARASRPAGSVCWICVDLVAHGVGDGRRAVALGLLDVDADGLLAVEQRGRARLLGADVDVATSPSRMTRPPGSATTMLREVLGVSRRGRRRRIVRSS